MISKSFHNITMLKPYILVQQATVTAALEARNRSRLFMVHFRSTSGPLKLDF